MVGKSFAILSDTDAVRAEIVRRTGMRQNTKRVKAAADVVALFVFVGEFCRVDVHRELAGKEYGTRCLDRALADLEAAGVIECVSENEAKLGAGGAYRVTPMGEWSTRCPDRQKQRTERRRKAG